MPPKSANAERRPYVSSLSIRPEVSEERRRAVPELILTGILVYGGLSEVIVAVSSNGLPDDDSRWRKCTEPSQHSGNPVGGFETGYWLDDSGSR